MDLRTLYLEHVPVLSCCMTNEMTAPSHTSMGPISRPSVQAGLHVVSLILAPKNRYVRMGTNNSLTQCVSMNDNQNYETLECIEWEQQMQEEVTLLPHLIGCWWNRAPVPDDMQQRK